MVSIKIDENSLDPGTLMHLTLVTVTCESSSYQVFHSFYEEIENEFYISTKAKSLFLSLAESTAQTLTVTLCYVEEPTGQSIGLGSKGRWTHGVLQWECFPEKWERCLAPKNFHHRSYCNSLSKGQFSTLVWYLTCLGERFYNNTAQKTQ
jgi:hypothetical protein